MNLPPKIMLSADLNFRQLGTVLDQCLGPHGEAIELGTADDETEVLEKASDLVLQITFDLDEQRPAHQKRLDQVAVDIPRTSLNQPVCIDARNIFSFMAYRSPRVVPAGSTPASIHRLSHFVITQFPRIAPGASMKGQRHCYSSCAAGR
jgi:hypothetical protein